MDLKHILVDLDNTIYPASSGLFTEINRRMTGFVSGYFHISAKEAGRLRMDYMEKYGTTLNGLLKENNFNGTEEFFKVIHPENIGDFLKKDTELSESLLSIPVPKSIVTNSPKEHAVRVLKFLELEDRFCNLFDIRYANFEGKPHKHFFRKILKVISLRPEEVLLIDDHKQYLIPFKEMGGKVLLVKENSQKEKDSDMPVIGYLKELPEYLKRNNLV
jgi:putative hydrolase of the HAD superfamily